METNKIPSDHKIELPLNELTRELHLPNQFNESSIQEAGIDLFYSSFIIKRIEFSERTEIFVLFSNIKRKIKSVLILDKYSLLSNSQQFAVDKSRAHSNTD